MYGPRRPYPVLWRNLDIDFAIAAEALRILPHGLGEPLNPLRGNPCKQITESELGILGTAYSIRCDATTAR